MNKRKGISLIVLVITILVMIILAGVVVVSLQKNNPIQKAKEAVGTSNLISIKEELEMYKINELSLEKDTNINMSFAEADKNLKSIPAELKNSVLVENGMLGVKYSKLTEEVQKFAKENDIFDAEDNILPDADVYVVEKNGKKYIRVDAVDYETDIAKIKSSTGEEKIPDLNYEKILILCDFTKNRLFKNELSKKFKNVEYDENAYKNTKKYNVLVGYGAQFKAFINKEQEDTIINRFNSASKEKPTYIVSGGNDTQIICPEIFSGCKGSCAFKVSNKLVNNIITRKIDESSNYESYFTDDQRTSIKFSNSQFLERYYKNESNPEYDDCIGMYLDRENKKGWFHMQECGDYDIPEEIKLTANIFKAAITKMTGSRSMEVEVKESGTYTFEIYDLAGNKLVKIINI